MINNEAVKDTVVGWRKSKSFYILPLITFVQNSRPKCLNSKGQILTVIFGISLETPFMYKSGVVIASSHLYL
jgi:hypothetical protein